MYQDESCIERMGCIDGLLNKVYLCSNVHSADVESARQTNPEISRVQVHNFYKVE